MAATTTLTAALTAKLEAHNAKNAEKNALKLKFASEIAAEIKAAKENGGATLGDLRHIVTLCGCAAAKFTEDLSCNGSETLETAEQRAENLISAISTPDAANTTSPRKRVKKPQKETHK